MTPSIGEYRKQSMLRVVGFVIYYALVLIVGPVIAIVLFIAMAGDLLWQFVLNREGLTGDELPSRVFDRRTEVREWLLFGTGDRPSTPSRPKRLKRK